MLRQLSGRLIQSYAAQRAAAIPSMGTYPVQLVVHRIVALCVTTQGKVVQTHSTYCDGLLDFANALASRPDISRIVPGRITRSRGQTEHFELMVKTATDSGWKCVARKGSQLQEVFLVTTASKAALETAIEETYTQVAPKRSRRTRAAQRARGHILVSNA